MTPRQLELSRMAVRVAATALDYMVEDLAEAEDAIMAADAMLAREQSDRMAVEADNASLRTALDAIAQAAGVTWSDDEDMAQNTRRVVAAIGGGR